MTNPRISKGKKGAPRLTHDPATKAAVLAALMAGQAVESIAREYNIPKGTVDGWKSKMKGDAPVSLPAEKKAEIGELLVDHLRELLATLTLQMRTIFRNEGWFLTQTAGEMAVLHGVLTDKAIRLLEAMAAADTESAPNVAD